MSNSHDIGRLVAQSARTVQLLGVDFVPLGRREGGGLSALAGATITERPAALVEPKLGASVQSDGRRDDADADRAARQAALDALRARYEREAPHAPFITSFTKIVFGEGDPCARLMFIGEAPGADEDRTGRPFVGRAGQLLDKMMVAMGLARERVYIANVLKVRPPDNATPTLEETEASKPYLYEQIAIVRPEVIVTLGLPASRTILNSTQTMSQMRGSWATYRAEGLTGQEGFTIPVMPTFHPAFILRAYTDENRGKVWSDLKQVMGKLGMESRKV